MDDDGGSGGIGDNDMYKERAKLVLVSFSDLYFELDLILVDVSRLFSCFISHCLLTT